MNTVKIKLVKLLTVGLLPILLSGCWSAKFDLFESDRDYIFPASRHSVAIERFFLIPEMPSEFLVNYDGKSYSFDRIDDRTHNSIPTYRGGGYEEVKVLLLSGNGMTFVAQAKQEGTDTYKIIAFNTNYSSDPSKFIKTRFNSDIEATAVYEIDANNNINAGYELKELRDEISRISALSKNSHERIVIRIIDDLDGEGREEIIAENETKYKNDRFLRATKQHFLDNCNNSRIATGGGLWTLPGIFTNAEVIDQSCVVRSGPVSIVLTVDAIESLICEGDSKRKTCSFRYSLGCWAGSSIANNDFVNDAGCASLRLGSQPVVARLVDDGRDVVFSSFEQFRP